MAYAGNHRGRGHPCCSVISTKVHNSSFVGIILLREVFPCRFAALFWALYYGMASEGLPLLHHILQIHCIVNVTTCRKGPDNKTIVFCRSLQILT